MIEAKVLITKEKIVGNSLFPNDSNFYVRLGVYSLPIEDDPNPVLPYISSRECLRKQREKSIKTIFSKELDLNEETPNDYVWRVADELGGLVDYGSNCTGITAIFLEFKVSELVKIIENE
jgi:hypothetical protein